ncbi:putative cysteine synthase [Medicago truncatula]|uniref:Putative cysteine synthase n=2 Tax=Medicago truncatula TaxID=3880 RepID=A0A396JBJ4_MEDTR|nr:putative cysteine synthase [Medicago truncatula]
MFLSKLLAEPLAVAFIAAYKLTLTMPASMSLERRILLHTFVAEVSCISRILLGFNGSHQKADVYIIINCFLIVSSLYSSYYQTRINNIKAFIISILFFYLKSINFKTFLSIHQETTGPEIWRDSAGKVDALVAGNRNNNRCREIPQGEKPWNQGKRPENTGKLIAVCRFTSFKNNMGMVVFPGFRARYLSSQMFESYKHEADISLQGTATSLPLG